MIKKLGRYYKRKEIRIIIIITPKIWCCLKQKEHIISDKIILIILISFLRRLAYAELIIR